MSPPAIPAPAATLVLLRDRPGGPAEILLIQRHGRSKFAAGDYVYICFLPDKADGAPHFTKGMIQAVTVS